MRVASLLLLLPAGLAAQSPVMQAVRPQYDTVKRNLIEAAEAMPEDQFGFKLTPAQRAFGDWIDHTAGMNARMCGQMKGAAASSPDAGDKSKAALVKALKESFATCDSTFDAMTDESATREVQMGQRKFTPLSVMVSQIAQLNAHYGNLVGYLRSRGVTPPSTARAQKK